MTDEICNQLDQMLHLLRDMVKLEDRIVKMEEKVGKQLDRMEAAQLDSGKLVDRLIEMAMVVKGQGDQAVLHRAQAGRDSRGFEAWNDVEEKDETWPPEGADCMDIRG